MEANAYLKTNSIDSGTTAPLIIGATMFSLFFMFIFIWLGFPIWLTVGLFIAIIYFSIYSFVYTAQYWIYNDRLEESLTPKLSFMPFIKAKQNTYAWADLESYLQDATLTRYYGERPYLKLYFINPKRQVHINAGNEAFEKKEFAQFIAAFNALTNDNQPQPTINIDAETGALPETQQTTTVTIPQENTSITNTPSPIKPIHAKAKKSFYETVWAKLLALLFLVITATLIGIYYFPSSFGGIELKGTMGWRLWIIIVPGTLYMMNRAFFSKKK